MTKTAELYWLGIGTGVGVCVAVNMVRGIVGDWFQWWRDRKGMRTFTSDIDEEREGESIAADESEDEDEIISDYKVGDWLVFKDARIAYRYGVIMKESDSDIEIRWYHENGYNSFSQIYNAYYLRQDAIHSLIAKIDVPASIRRGVYCGDTIEWTDEKGATKRAYVSQWVNTSTYMVDVEYDTAPYSRCRTMTKDEINAKTVRRAGYPR